MVAEIMTQQLAAGMAALTPSWAWRAFEHARQLYRFMFRCVEEVGGGGPGACKVMDGKSSGLLFPIP